MSQIRVNDIRDSGGGNSSTPNQILNGRAKAWVNFNGQGTVAIRADYNVNTVGDKGTGYYTVNFSSSLPSNYAVVGAGSKISGNQQIVVCAPFNTTMGTGSIQLVTLNDGVAERDAAYACLAFFTA